MAKKRQASIFIYGIDREKSNIVKGNEKVNNECNIGVIDVKITYDEIENLRIIKWEKYIQNIKANMRVTSIF